MRAFSETNRTFWDVWVYYRDIRFNNLFSPKYRHVWWILFWPLFGIAFSIWEKILPLDFAPVVSTLDAYIPFCEYFVIPYYYWFAYLVGMLAYTFLFNPPVFHRSMLLIAFTYVFTLVVYAIFPSMQLLRPSTFETDNICIDIIRHLYDFDTNTNVCPSIHVLGSMAACIAGLECERFATVGGRIFHWASTILICASTVFVKQHSIIDVITALILFYVALGILYFVKGIPPYVKLKSIHQKKETVVNKL